MLMCVWGRDSATDSLSLVVLIIFKYTYRNGVRSYTQGGNRMFVTIFKGHCFYSTLSICITVKSFDFRRRHSKLYQAQFNQPSASVLIARGDCGKRGDKGLFGVVKNGLLSPSQRCFEVTFHSNVVLSAARSAPAAPALQKSTCNVLNTVLRHFVSTGSRSSRQNYYQFLEHSKRGPKVLIWRLIKPRSIGLPTHAGILDTALIRAS